jgi:hypothetical protein
MFNMNLPKGENYFIVQLIVQVKILGNFVTQQLNNGNCKLF